MLQRTKKLLAWLLIALQMGTTFPLQTLADDVSEYEDVSDIMVEEPIEEPDENTATAAPEKTPAPTATPIPDGYDPQKPELLNDGQLRGESCILIDADTGNVLYEKNADARMEPASTTKIMTLMLGIEYGRNKKLFNKVVTMPKEVNKVPGDSTRVPVVPGEKIKYSDLLYGFMLRSGNDAGNAIGMIVSKSLKKFVNKMNARAEKLGCTGTHFANAHGYEDSDHYTTARDLSLIAREGMKDALFRKIVGTVNYTIPKNNKQKHALNLRTHYHLLWTNDKDYYPYATGIKSGYFSKAGYCFVGSGSKDGVNLITVSLKGTADGRWEDARRLMEYGFAQYRNRTFEELYPLAPKTLKIQDGGELPLSLEPGGSLNAYTVLSPENMIEAIAKSLDQRTITQFNGQLQAPIHKGDVLGTIALETEDGRLLSTRLLADGNVAAAPAETIAPIEEEEITDPPDEGHDEVEPKMVDEPAVLRPAGRNPDQSNALLLAFGGFGAVCFIGAVVMMLMRRKTRIK